MVQHILARFTYCNEKFCALFFRFFFVFFFFRKVLECDSMRFLHPSQVKTQSFAYYRGFKFQVLLEKTRKKPKKKKKQTKKNEKSTKSTYTIVSAICDCPPEVRRKPKYAHRTLPTCSHLRLDCSYAFAVVVCVAAEYAR